MELVANTAKTLTETDFGDIDTSDKNYAIALDVLKGQSGVQVKMHQTADEDDHNDHRTRKTFWPDNDKGGK